MQCHGVLSGLVAGTEVALPEPCQPLPTAIDCELEGLKSLVGSLQDEVQIFPPRLLLVVEMGGTWMLSNQGCTFSQMNFSTSRFSGIKVTFCLQQGSVFTELCPMSVIIMCIRVLNYILHGGLEHEGLGEISLIVTKI